MRKGRAVAKVICRTRRHNLGWYVEKSAFFDMSQDESPPTPVSYRNHPITSCTSMKATAKLFGSISSAKKPFKNSKIEGENAFTRTGQLRHTHYCLAPGR